MKRKNLLLLLLTFVSLFFLNGCVRLVQEMTIREDGTGVVRFALGVETEYYDQVQEEIPEGYELENLLSTLIQDDRVTSVSQEQFEEQGWTWDVVQLEVEDMAALFAEERRIGPLRISMDEEEGEVAFMQTIDVANSTLTIPGINLMDLREASYSVRLVAPQILESSGVQVKAGESVWEVGLSDLLQTGEGLILWADYSLEPYEGVFIPWETFFDTVVIGYLGLGALAILVVIIVNTTGKRRSRRGM